MIEPQAEGPVVHVSTMGAVANQMIQFLIAVALAEKAGRARFSNVDLPIWGIRHPWIAHDAERTEIVTADRVELDRLARALTVGQLDCVDIRTYGQRIENFPEVATCREVFRHQGTAYAGVGPDELLCSIRQGEVLDARHPDYVLIPPAFYAELAEHTGKRLVFMGQLEDSLYMTELRRRFPQARFLPSRGPAADFERIRRSSHVVPAISTFSWLAAWLSEAEQIYLPVLGLFHPFQNRNVDLLPLADPRYRFYVFPISYAMPVALHEAAHHALNGLWRYMPADRLAAWFARPPPTRPRELYLEAFDESFYRAVHPDIVAAIEAGHLPNGRHHYKLYGFDEGRVGFALDRAWYCREYPVAALEISQGDYYDADHHWLEMGRARGYRQGPG